MLGGILLRLVARVVARLRPVERGHTLGDGLSDPIRGGGNDVDLDGVGDRVLRRIGVDVRRRCRPGISQNQLPRESCRVVAPCWEQRQVGVERQRMAIGDALWTASVLSPRPPAARIGQKARLGHSAAIGRRVQHDAGELPVLRGWCGLRRRMVR